MANINLLPEQMRDKEKKEMLKAAKQPKIFSVDLSPGKKEKPLAPIKPSKPKRSLWSEIFGGKVKPTPIVKQLPQFGQRIDMLEAAKKQNIKYKSAPVRNNFQAKNNFFSSVGPVQSPIKSPVTDKIPATNPSFEPPQKAVTEKVDFKYNTEVRKSGLGFWASLFNLFSFGSKSVKQSKVNRKTLEKDALNQVNLKMPESVNPREVIKSKYHTAPKGQKSKLDINLVPEELLFRKYPKNRQQIFGAIIALFIPALIITAVYVAIDQQQKAVQSKIVSLNNDKNKLVAYISDFKGIQEKNIRLQDKLLAIDKLLEKHVYWTKFFGLLEKYTLDDVYYTEFTADTSGQFMLPAVAAIGSGSTIEEQIADSYRKVAQQITALEKADDFVKQVKVNNLEVISGENAGVKGVKFDINLALTDGIFINENN